MTLTNWEREELEALREMVRAQAKLIEAYEHKMGMKLVLDEEARPKEPTLYCVPTSVKCNTSTEGVKK